MTPPLRGLVLAGGLSSRMGSPKTGLRFRAEDQAHYLVRLLDEVCGAAWLSIGSQSDRGIELSDLPCIRDRVSDLGPAAGLLSAWDLIPAAAWLVAAVDMPFLDRATVDLLVSSRDPSKAATMALNPLTRRLEPLFGIYEPCLRPVIEESVSAGHPGLAGILARCMGRMEGPGVALVPFGDARVLVDVDTREEYRIMKGGAA